MKRGYELGGKHAHDPIGSDQGRGGESYQRKSGRDPGFTPTEQRQKAQLMKQFCKLEGPAGNSEAYRTSWKRMFGRRTGEHSGQNVTMDDYPDCIGNQDETCDDSDCWCHFDP